jgi:hypothetical protein
MAYCNVVADSHCGPIITVNDHIVLNVRVFANRHFALVSSNDRIEPNTRPFSNFDVSVNLGTFCNKDGGMNYWSQNFGSWL